MKSITFTLLLLFWGTASFSQMRDGNKIASIGIGLTDVNYVIKAGYTEIVTRRLMLSGIAQYEKGKTENKYFNLGLNIQIGYFFPFFRYKAYFVPHAGVIGLSEKGLISDYSIKQYWNYGAFMGTDINFYIEPNLIIGAFVNQKYYVKDYFGKATYDLGLKLAYSFF